MKPVRLFIGISIVILALQSCSDKEAEPTGLPGDNLDLFAVLNLFETSGSIEGFEKSLNDKSTGVNNMDLNGDGKVDYIRVVDLHSGDAHAITLRIPVTPEENQDVAVIEIEKTSENTASIQIIGDEDMYGKDVIVEPKDGAEKAGFIYASSVGVNVYHWPSVTYVYSPAYVVWESPYYYDYYPVYWSPWEPVEYRVYHPMVYKNHGQYVKYNKHRFRNAHEMYYSNRMSSGFVKGRHKNGDFKGGKQARYKGDFPKGNGNGGNGKDFGDKRGGNDKHDGNNNHGGNDKQGRNDKQGGNDGGQKGNNNKMDNSKKQGGDNSPKASSPKGGNQKQGGGGSPKGGKSGGGKK